MPHLFFSYVDIISPFLSKNLADYSLQQYCRISIQIFDKIVNKMDFENYLPVSFSLDVL